MLERVCLQRWMWGQARKRGDGIDGILTVQMSAGTRMMMEMVQNHA